MNRDRVTWRDVDWGDVGFALRVMSPPEPPEDDPVELCEECGAMVQDDVPALERVCWRCGEAL